MKKVCVIGYPVEQSLSPQIHNYWLKKYSIEGVYEKREIKPEEFDKVFPRLEEEGYVGCNVTIPFKEKAFEFVKEKGEILGDAASVSAINTIKFEKGKILGKNTDIEGFVSNIKNNSKNFDFTKGKVVVLGSGGAARAVVKGLFNEKVPEIIIVNRSKERAVRLLEDLKITSNTKVVEWEEKDTVLRNVNLLINTTSLGMQNQKELDINLDLLPKEALVTDIVYKPLYTKLLTDAKARGNDIVDGLGMLLYQAVPGFTWWFGKRPEVDGGVRKELIK